MNLTMIDKMKHSPLQNYAGVPGLTSWLIGEKGPSGCVRLFECERNHDEHITPHSHRFDFECIVLAGKVKNVIYRTHGNGLCHLPSVDKFSETTMAYGGKCGTYTPAESRYVTASRDSIGYAAGDRYSMKAHEIHSIYFSKGAKVLFFEGPQVRNTSVILQPWCYGEAVPTFKVEPWMFKKPEAQS